MRSGSTMQYNQVCELVEETGYGKREGHFTDSDLKNRQEDLASWAHDPTLHVIKSHCLSPQLIDLANEGKARVIYIYRDLRDVAASSKQKFKYRNERLIRHLDSLVEIYYLARSINGTFTQQYEKSIMNSHAAIQEQARFLGIEANDNIIKDIEEKCSLESAKAKMARLNNTLAGRVKRFFDKLPIRIPKLTHFLSDRVYDERTQYHADHISCSEGRPGAWSSILSENESRIIASRYQSWLKETGYL